MANSTGSTRPTFCFGRTDAGRRDERLYLNQSARSGGCSSEDGFASILLTWRLGAAAGEAPIFLPGQAQVRRPMNQGYFPRSSISESDPREGPATFGAMHVVGHRAGIQGRRGLRSRTLDEGPRARQPRTSPDSEWRHNVRPQLPVSSVNPGESARGTRCVRCPFGVAASDLPRSPKRHQPTTRSSWNDGPAKQAILDFVRATTDRRAPDSCRRKNASQRSIRMAPCGSSTRCTRQCVLPGSGA